jgi:hypothetical protein
MQANQKLEAEAGALRVLLQHIVEVGTYARDLEEVLLAIAPARAALAVTDAGKEVAERITGYQEQLKLNTRLIELLRDHRTSLAAQNRVLAPGLNDALDMLRILLDARTVAVDMKGYRDRYYAVKDSVAAINAHKYADLLSMATSFQLTNDFDGPVIRKSLEGGWCIADRGIHGALDVWCLDTQKFESPWPTETSRWLFATLEAAFAYVEDHPAALGLQLIDNAPNSVLDSIQPHR